MTKLSDMVLLMIRMHELFFDVCQNYYRLKWIVFTANTYNKILLVKFHRFILWHTRNAIEYVKVQKSAISRKVAFRFNFIIRCPKPHLLHHHWTTFSTYLIYLRYILLSSLFLNFIIFLFWTSRFFIHSNQVWHGY